MREFILEIPKSLEGFEIKQILKNHFGFSSSLITDLKKGDYIMLCGKKEFVTKTVSEGDILKIVLPDSRSENITPENIPLDILFEDEDLLIVNKPPKMPTHPSVYHNTGTVANAVMFRYRDIPFTFRAPSRLDRDTSGVLIIAKNAFAAMKISNQIKEGSFRKEYLALCTGTPDPPEGTISAPIKREGAGIIKRQISPDGKPAVTDYSVIESRGGFSLIRLFPKTGRTHQIRLHLAYLGVPIYADFLYGTDVENERIRLHCHRVTFTHPATNEVTVITAPLPEDMSISYLLSEKPE